MRSSLNSLSTATMRRRAGPGWEPLPSLSPRSRRCILATPTVRLGAFWTCGVACTLQNRRPPSRGRWPWEWLANKPGVATAVLLCFGALLRASEATRLRSANVLFSGSSVVLLLGVTKRGLEGKVTITEPTLVAWLTLYRKLAATKGKLPEYFCQCSYSQLQRSLRQATRALGFGDSWSTHGLRRGGATAMLAAGAPLPNIMLYGRWVAERSCRDYLRRGEVTLLRGRGAYPASAWELVRLLGVLGHRSLLVAEGVI